MPTYDYVCDACKHEFEEFQSITAAPLKKCPKCGKSKLVRLLGTGGGIIFKGGGFYQTDYRSDSYKKSAEADAKASKGELTGESGKKDESKKADTAKSETKPAAESAAPAKPAEPKPAAEKAAKSSSKKKSKAT